MTEYPHIDSIYKRYTEGPNKGRFIFGQYSRPEFEYLKDNSWVWTEKVDGTNIRIILRPDPDMPEIKYARVEFGGKTNNSQLPTKLYGYLQETFTLDRLGLAFPVNEYDVVLYGEGHGAGIQKGGGNYSKDQRFVLFDVRIGHWWLKRDALEDIAQKLEIPIVPIVTIGPLGLAEELVQNDVVQSAWGNFKAEGLVGKPQLDLLDGAGKRIITKIKHVDYR